MGDPIPQAGDEFDVLVAGAGGMGVLTAAALDDLGYSCALVDPVGIAAEQTGHSHGYLHRGYIYLRAEEKLVSNLRNARDLWDAVIDPADVVSSSSLVGFSDTVAQSAAVRSWEAAGLPVVPAEPLDLPAQIRRPAVRHLYRTDEPVVLAGQLLKRRRDACRHVVDFPGRVQRLQLKRATCVGAVIDMDGQPVSIRARHVVLCAGAGNAAILNNTMGIYRAASALRTSFMLVMKGLALQPLSLILPETQFYGLFMASRRQGAIGVWLASNFVSYGGVVRATTPAGMRWARDMIRKVEKVFDVSVGSLQYGVYAGVKAEYRRDPERMPEDKAVETFGIQKLSALWPTKLTLAPALAASLARQIDRELKEPRCTAPSLSRLRLRRERWEATPCFDRSALFDNLAQLSVAERWS
ncbi:MAG TPA: FAD-dependent oxidoreductase [Thermoanaerobaculia bacterium]